MIAKIINKSYFILSTKAKIIYVFYIYNNRNSKILLYYRNSKTLNNKKERMNEYIINIYTIHIMEKKTLIIKIYNKKKRKKND